MPDAVPDLTVPDPAAPDPAAPGAAVPGAVGPGLPDLAGPHPGAAGTAMLTGDLVPGESALGAPTVDSDADGLPDTAVAEVADQLVLATDLDHDGRADAVTRIGPEGVVTARAGDAGASDRPWDGPPSPPPSVDPRTGEWIRG